MNETTNKKIAMYDYGDGLTTCSEISEYWESKYIRISEPIEVEFTMLSREETVIKGIAMIDKRINQINLNAQLEINRLEQKKQELLALEHK